MLNGDYEYENFMNMEMLHGTQVLFHKFYWQTSTFSQVASILKTNTQSPTQKILNDY